MQVGFHAWLLKHSEVSQVIRPNTDFVKPFTAMLMSAASSSFQLELSNQS